MLWGRMLRQWNIVRTVRIISHGPHKDREKLYFNPRGAQAPVHLGLGTFSCADMSLHVVDPSQGGVA